MKAKVGILGGTFNPVHLGHVDLGLQICQSFQLERVFYILSARPPHKKNMGVVSVDLRWKMLTNALKPYPHLHPCDIEMNRTSDSWTIDTIEELKMRFPDDSLYFISGSEGFLKIRTWKEYQRLLNEVLFIVIIRDRSHISEVKRLLSEEGISNSEVIINKKDNSNADSRVILYKYQSEYLHISSTLVRQQVKVSGYDAMDQWVGKEVKKIMEEYKLYET